MSDIDVRGSETWNRVEEHFRRLHGPGFGRPHRLLEPSASPDGTWVAATGLVLDELVGMPRQEVRVLVGERLRRLGTQAASTPRFSPDGNHLAVLVEDHAPGVKQVAVLPVDALGSFDGPIEVTARVPGSVEQLAWSPDGRSVLLGVAELGADLAGGQGSGRIGAVDTDVPSWHPEVESGSEPAGWRSAWVLDVASGEAARWSPEGLNAWEVTWLGSDALLAIVSSSPDEGAWYSASLVRLGRDGRVSDVHRTAVQLGWPSASPSGELVAVAQAVCSDRWVVAGDLLVGEPGALARVDTRGVDVTATSWIDDNRVGFAGQRGLETVVGVHDTTTGTTRELWASEDTSCGYRYPEVCFTADGGAVLVEDGYAVAPRVLRIPADGGEPVVLHDTRHAGTDHLLARHGVAEAVRWEAPDGTEIEGFLCRPSTPGPHPLVVNIHGGPVWAFRGTWQLFYPWVPLLVSQGYAVLNPNPRGSAGRGQAFTAPVLGDMGGADTDDFLSGIDALVERGIADPGRIGLTGASYGGFMSSWLVTRRPFAAAVPTSPVTDWYSQHYSSNIPFFDRLFLAGDPAVPGDRFHERSPVVHAHRVTTPCLNVAGARDRCTPPGQAREFHTALVEQGVESVLAIYPEEGHGVRAFPALLDYCTRMLAWFERHMPASLEQSSVDRG